MQNKNSRQTDVVRIETAASDADFIRKALDATAIVAITDVRGTITYANAKFCEISGYEQSELIGNNHRIIRSGRHSKAFFREMYRCIARGEVWRGEICNRRKDGSLYWVDTTIVPHLDENGKPDSYTSIRFDITARHEAEDYLRQIVNTDPLTGIANRRRFHEYLGSALEKLGAELKRIHLVLIDIDAFKQINDSFGHDVGDSLLKVLAARLADFESDDRFIARLGGDEFGFVASNHSDADIRDLLDRLLASIKRPIQLSGAKHRYSASIGVASCPDQARTAEDLFKAADLALYEAKTAGRDQYSIFAPRLQQIADRRQELLQAAEAGLEQSQFQLHYQPQVPVDPSDPLSFEALLRWQHPERGLLAPGGFLATMNDPGLDAAIGMFVLEQVFNDMVFMGENGLAVGRIAFNVTNADFRSDRFIDRFFELSATTGIPPHRFSIEVVEQVFLDNDPRALAGRLARLHDAGVEIALDDFGTGFASLTHLRHMPIDRVKIDKSFVSRLPENSGDLAIVEGIINIAHALGKSVTAEGVEAIHQVQFLYDLGCDYLQGWYFAKASSKEDLPQIVRQVAELRQNACGIATSPKFVCRGRAT